MRQQKIIQTVLYCLVLALAAIVAIHIIQTLTDLLVRGFLTSATLTFMGALLMIDGGVIMVTVDTIIQTIQEY